jgi:excisionase family DNA binding protein
MTTVDAPEFVKVKEAARLLGVSRNTVARLIASGKLRAVKLGPRQTRIPVASIAALADT